MLNQEMSEPKKARLHSYEDCSDDDESECPIIAPSSSKESVCSTSSLEQEMEKYRAPEATFLELCARAILASPLKRLCVQDIYDWLVDKYPYFTVAPPHWRNSVRYALSKHYCFVKVSRCKDRRGFYWGIHSASISDFMNGDFSRRRVCQQVADFQTPTFHHHPRAGVNYHSGNQSCPPPTWSPPSTLGPNPSSSWIPPPSTLEPNPSSSWMPLLRPLLPSPLEWLPSPLTTPPSPLGTFPVMFQAPPSSPSLLPANNYPQ